MGSVQELKSTAQRIMSAALRAADPAAAVARTLARGAGGFLVNGRRCPVEGKLYLVAVGKASQGMAAAALGILGESVTEAIVVSPRGYGRTLEASPPRISLLETGHPVPDEKGIAAAHRVSALVAGMGERDTCIVLLSGGGSSLLPLPLPPVTLSEKMETTALLLDSGADIREINTVRKHISAIKGGRLAERARGRIVTLAISDVVGDSIDSIASGPTVRDPTAFADAREILARYRLLERVPAAVRRTIEDGVAGRVPETPKDLPARHEALVIASNRIAVEAAMREASACGFAPLLLTTFLAGEAREAGRLIAEIAREARASARPIAAPACIVAGGETTVTVTGGGKGGRNQEIALAAAVELAGESGILITSFATDGREGTTEAAGGYASADTLAAGMRAGLDPRACLADNDSHSFLSAAGECIVTGATGTNVNDITFALIDERGSGIRSSS